MSTRGTLPAGVHATGPGLAREAALGRALTHHGEVALAVFGTLVLTGFFRVLTVICGDGSRADIDAGNALTQVLGLAAYLPALALLLAGRRPFVRLLIGAWPLSALLAFAALSVMWSSDPGTTARRVFALGLTMGFVLWMVVRFTPREILRLWAMAFLVIVAVSLVVCVALPQIGVHQGDMHDGRWRGTFAHKNHFGRAMALAVCVLWFARSLGPFWRRWGTAGAAIAAAMLVLSGSATALVSLLAAGAAVLLLSRAGGARLDAGRRTLSPGLRIAIVLLAGGVFAILVLAHAEMLVALTGRDLTFSGRTGIWDSAIMLGQERPLFGAGYRAFWIEDRSFAISQLFFANWFAERQDDVIGNGHNGYLDHWLELGFAGLALLAVLIGAFGRKLLAFAASGPDPALRVFIALFAFLLVYSVAERVILQQGEFAWAAFAAAFLMLVQIERRRAP